jgi:hypothetical protein
MMSSAFELFGGGVGVLATLRGAEERVLALALAWLAASLLPGLGPLAAIVLAPMWTVLHVSHPRVARKCLVRSKRKKEKKKKNIVFHCKDKGRPVCYCCGWNAVSTGRRARIEMNSIKCRLW